MKELLDRLRGYEPICGSWAVAQQIFSGNNSSVFLLKRLRGGATVYSALKVIEILKRNDKDIETNLTRALNEIEKMEQLSACGNIVSILDDELIDIHDDNGCLAGYDVLVRMEYLKCLSDRIRNEEILTEEEIVRLGKDLCNALSFAHSLGIIHRDIKPANIYQTAVGSFKLGDFGVSKHMENDLLTTVTGTLAYMAPEVARGEPYGVTADIYSLGIVLYQLLNNNLLPFTDQNSSYSELGTATRRRWKGAKLPLPKRGNRRIHKVVMRMCHTNPEKRFASADEVITALNRKTFNPVLRFIAAAVIFASVLSGIFFSYLWKGVSDYYSDSYRNQNSIMVFKNHRYEVIPRKESWESAKIYCASQGGHLATITSREEEEEVIKLLEKNGITVSWLGADNRNSSNGYSWVTGEKFGYAAWGVGEPNNTNRSEHCLMLIKSEKYGWIWNDAPDNGYDYYKTMELGFVCEWEGLRP